MARASSSMTPRRMSMCVRRAQTLTYRFATYELGRELKYYRASGCKSCALKSRCTRNKANRTITREENEHLMEAMAARMRAAAAQVQIAQDAGRTSLWDDQALVWLHALFAEGAGESAVRMEPDDAGLQSQTGVEPGELREIDGGGGLKARRQRLPAKKWPVPTYNPGNSPPQPECLASDSTKKQTSHFHSNPFASPLGSDSFHTASRLVRRLVNLI